jgi:hypothetical protein
MKLFRKMRLIDKYKVEPSNDEKGKYIVFHITRSLRGCNYQRVFKGNYRECYKEKQRLENEQKNFKYKGELI